MKRLRTSENLFCAIFPVLLVLKRSDFRGAHTSLFKQITDICNVLILFLVLSKTTSLRLLKRGTSLGMRRLFTALSEIFVEGRFLNSRARHFPPLSANALSRLFLQITGAKRKPSGTRLLSSLF